MSDITDKLEASALAEARRQVARHATRIIPHIFGMQADGTVWVSAATPDDINPSVTARVAALVKDKPFVAATLLAEVRLESGQFAAVIFSKDNQRLYASTLRISYDSRHRIMLASKPVAYEGPEDFFADATFLTEAAPVPELVAVPA